MTHDERDELDHLLGSHDDIVPSSGFADAVMAAVRHDAWATPPLRFPWKHAARGPLMAAVAVGIGLASGVVRPAAIGSAVPDAVGSSGVLASIGDAALSGRLGWLALAVLLTLVSVGVSSHLASRVERHG
jgi:hypothetical protein